MVSACANKDSTCQAQRVSIACRLAFALLFVVSWSGEPVSAAEYVGAIPGDFSVSQNGAAVYRIPIDVPDATGGLYPNLSIVYNNQGGVGAIGHRWSLTGVSRISRCPKTIAQDGIARGVEYDLEDRYCLDGQRLVAISGTYGVAGSEYRTEIESFRKIVAVGTSGNGPSHFIVNDPDGTWHSYSAAGGSKFGTHGYWARSTTNDLFGNRIEYYYVDGTTTGEFLVDRIEYTSNGMQGLSPKYAIQFNYENRPVTDNRSGYTFGVLWSYSRRLDEIRVYRMDAQEQIADVVREYKFGYQTGASGRSQLISIEQCKYLGVSKCLPKTLFEWNNGSIGWDPAISSGQSSSGHSDVRVGDFNGDGLDDLFVVKNGEWHILTASQGSLNTAIDTNKLATNAQYTKPFDFNGDGMTDLLVPASDSKWHVYQSTGTGFTDINTGESSTGYQNSYAQDVDGDGIGDVLYLSGTSIYLRKGTGTDLSTTATVVFSDPLLVGFVGQPDRSPHRQVDFDNDGRGDVLAHHYEVEFDPEEGYTVYDGWNALRYDGSSFRSIGLGLPSTSGAPIPVDLNNDGLSDVAYRVGSSWRHSISTGDGFSTPVTSAVTNTSSNDAVFADYNGDGRQDFIGKTSTDRVVHRFDGVSFESTGISIGGPLDTYAMRVNGDGSDELVGMQSNVWHVRTGKAQPDFVNKITDGLGNTFEPNYDSILDMADYFETISLTVTFPTQRVTKPLHVVDSYTASDGIGGTYNINYKYWDALTDAQGRGPLGFRVFRAIDSRNGTYRQTYLLQGWPYTGMRGSEDFRQSESNNVDFVRINRWLGQTTIGSGSSARIFRRTEKTQTIEYEVGGALNGQEVRKVIGDPVYDTSQGTYGSVTSETVTTTSAQAPGETYTTTINYQYGNFTTPWCLRLPTQTQITRVAPGATSKTRKINRTFSTTNCSLLTTTNTSEASAALQLKTTLTYDAYGNVKTVINDSADGATADRKTELFYDQWGQHQERQKSYIDNATDPETNFTWDYSLNQPLSFQDAQGHVTSWEYDDLGRRIKTTRPDGTTSDISFSDCIDCWVTGRGRFLITQTNSDGSDANDYRDRFGRSIGGWSRLPGGTTSNVQVDYDPLGRVSRQYQPWVGGESSYSATYAFDLLSRLTQINAPISEAVTSGALSTLTYQGLTQSITNADNQLTTTYFDPLGRVEKVTDALDGQTTYEYTVFDELHKTLDPASNVITVNYSDRGDRISMTDPDMGSWSYAYNVFGEPASQTDAKSQVTSFNFNQLGLITSRIEPEGTTSWNYFTTADHKLWSPSSVTSPGGFSEIYSYDTLSRQSSMTTTIDSIAYTTDLSYHSTGSGKGKLKRITYPTSTAGVRFKVDYDYDTWGQLDKVKNGDTPSTVYYQLHETDAFGRERLSTSGNGLDQDRIFDRANGFLKSIQTGPNLTSTVQNLSYQWNKLGVLEQRKDVNQSKTEGFTHDSLNRLKTASLNSSSTLSVNYDAIGNITYKSDVGTYTYGAGSAGPNAVTGITGTRPGNYTYDANGNMTNRVGDAITWYSYNKPNRIDYGSDYAEFTYGPDRSRFKQVAKTGSSTATTHYVGRHFEKEVSGGVTSYRHNIIAAGTTVAVYTRPSSGAITTRYPHRDHLGSVVALSNETGAVTEHFSFDAFGKRRNTDWTADTTDLQFGVSHQTDRGYTGHEQLDNVRLTHMNGRVQDPIIGRMISADVFVPGLYKSQAHNRYSYVLNNPLSLVDPSGYWPEWHWCGFLRLCPGPAPGGVDRAEHPGKPPKELLHCKNDACLYSWSELPWSFGPSISQIYFDTFDRDLVQFDEAEANNEEQLAGLNRDSSQTGESVEGRVPGTSSDPNSNAATPGDGSFDFGIITSALRAISLNSAKALKDSALSAPADPAGRMPASTAGWGLFSALGKAFGFANLAYDTGRFANDDLSGLEYSANSSATIAVMYGNPVVAGVGTFYFVEKLAVKRDQWLLEKYPELLDNPLWGASY